MTKLYTWRVNAWMWHIFRKTLHTYVIGYCVIGDTTVRNMVLNMTQVVKLKEDLACILFKSLNDYTHHDSLGYTRPNGIRITVDECQALYSKLIQITGDA